jgi:hypothetical protein
MDLLPKLCHAGSGRKSLRVRREDLSAWLGGPVTHEKQYLTLGEAAEVAGLSVKTFYNRLSLIRKVGKN